MTQPQGIEFVSIKEPLLNLNDPKIMALLSGQLNIKIIEEYKLRETLLNGRNLRTSYKSFNGPTLTFTQNEEQNEINLYIGAASKYLIIQLNPETLDIKNIENHNFDTLESNRINGFIPYTIGNALETATEKDKLVWVVN